MRFYICVRNLVIEYNAVFRKTSNGKQQNKPKLRIDDPGDPWFSITGLKNVGDVSM